MRCRGFAWDNGPTCKNALICHMCSFRSGVLGPGSMPARDACIICGRWVSGSRFGQPARTCMQHSTAIQAFSPCVICNKSVGGLTATEAKICTFCGGGMFRTRCSKLMV